MQRTIVRDDFVQEEARSSGEQERGDATEESMAMWRWRRRLGRRRSRGNNAGRRSCRRAARRLRRRRQQPHAGCAGSRGCGSEHCESVRPARLCCGEMSGDGENRRAEPQTRRPRKRSDRGADYSREMKSFRPISGLEIEGLCLKILAGSSSNTTQKIPPPPRHIRAH